MVEFLGRRGEFWTYVRRVPAVFAEHDKRGIIKQSTKVRIADDPRGIRAAKVVARINADTEAYWAGLHAGQAEDSRKRYEAARNFTRALGFSVLPAQDLLDLPASETHRRILALKARGVAPHSEGPAAVLGLVEKPEIRLSGLFEAYESIERAALADLSENQLRRWKNAKKLAVDVMIDIVGDKPLAEVTRGDALDLRRHWDERVLEGEVEIGTANKSFGHLGRMWRKVDRHHQLELSAVFADLRIEGGRDESRAAYAASFVQDKLLGGLAGMNEEARDVVWLMADSGLRIAEAVNLSAATILLDDPVPHVLVEPDGRRMKTPQSRRAVPLVGVALAAMKRHPEGFPRYLDKGASLSATVNKYFQDNGLRPTTGHSLYSLRHAFEDRLTAVEAPEKVIAALMGHKYSRPKYGDGPSLAQKREWMGRIAYSVPAAPAAD